jgi:hypothetical protein
VERHRGATRTSPSAPPSFPEWPFATVDQQTASGVATGTAKTRYRFGGTHRYCLRNPRLAGNAHRQGLVALHKTRIHSFGFANHHNIIEALEDFFPDDLQLQFGQSDPDATMNTEAEGNLNVLPRNSMSLSAVRRMCAIGVCQRITSGTKLSISAEFSRSFLY